MDLLVDLCTGARLARGLKEYGQIVNFVGNWVADPGDAEILRLGFENKAVVITRDKDFGTLAVLRRQHHSGIVRLVELSPDRELFLCLWVLTHHAEDLKRGCLITVERHRIRVREPDFEAEK
jgi:predicted nuclease of predicted toxin-antitoxin system